LAPLLMLPFGASARAETVSVAVAANFADAVKAIGVAFKAKTGNELSVSSGATGGLYTQISQGAPFEVFLAADSKTPQKAVAAGFGVAGTEFTYAVGKVVLFSANPKLAPYGAAAVEAMQKLGVAEALAPKLVTGESIAQAYQFVDSKNAEL